MIKSETIVHYMTDTVMTRLEFAGGEHFKPFVVGILYVYYAGKRDAPRTDAVDIGIGYVVNGDLAGMIIRLVAFQAVMMAMITVIIIVTVIIVTGIVVMFVRVIAGRTGVISLFSVGFIGMAFISMAVFRLQSEIAYAQEEAENIDKKTFVHQPKSVRVVPEIGANIDIF
jgi:hypothetical protein